MRFTRLLALRYTFGLRKKVAVTLISQFAAFVVGVAVFAFFVVLSVFGGLREFGLRFTHAFDPDIYVESAKTNTFDVKSFVFSEVAKHPGVETVSSTLSQEMMLKFGGQTAFAKIIGVDSLFRSVVDGKTMVGGWIQPNTRELVLGVGLLSSLNVRAYDHPKGIALLVPNQKKSKTLNKSPFLTKNAIVRGVFQLGEAIDENTAFAPISLVQSMMRVSKDQASALYVKASNNTDVDFLQKSLEKSLGSEYIVKTKAALNPALYKMLQTERLVVVAVLSLVVLIALFNIVGAIIMTLLEKKKDIKTLYLLGAPKNSLRKVFFLQGLFLSGVGGSVGLILALVLVWLQKSYLFIEIPGAKLPYPVALEWPSFFVVLLVVSMMTFMVSWLSSGIVTRVMSRQ